MFFFSKGDHITAINYYDKTIKINPNYARAYYNRGYVYNEMNQKNKACADWKKAASLGYANAKKKVSYPL